jgi:hypothetical protein
VLRRAELLARVASAVFLGVAVTVPPRSPRTAHADVATAARSAASRVSQRHLVELFDTSNGDGIMLSEQQRGFLSKLDTDSASDRNRVARLHADLRRAESVKLHLFDDVELVAVRKPLDLDGLSTRVWVGDLVDGGYALLATREDFLHGIVQTPTQTFRLSPLGEGVCAVRRVVDSGVAADVCGVPDVAPAHGARPATPRAPSLPALAPTLMPTPAPMHLSAPAPNRLASEPVVANIHVLVAYEEGAAQLVPDLFGHIETLVAWANLSYVNSRVHLATPGPCWPGVSCVLPQLRLTGVLGLGCEGCTDQAVSNSAILERFAAPEDGRFDEVHVLRDEVEADVCVLMTLVDRPNSNGVAMAGPPDPETAFCLVETPFSLEHPYIFAHEVGHLQDAQHHTGVLSSRPYARGYCYNPAEEPDDRFWTIMCTLSSSRVPFWSNPEIMYETKTGNLVEMGDDSHNNARRLNETALKVASHRGPVIVPVEIADFVAQESNGLVRVGWRLSPTALREITAVHVQRAEGVAGPYLERTSAPLQPAAVMQWEDPKVTPGSTYWYRLRLLPFTGVPEIVGPVQITVERWRTRLHTPVVADDQVRVRYSVGPGAVLVRLGLFDVRGRLVTILDQGTRGAGEYTLEWNRTTAAGVRLGNGVYLLQLRAGRNIATAKMLLPGD